MLIPKALQPGDTIGVIAPSDAIEEKDYTYIQASSKLFEDLGYNIKIGKNAYSKTWGFTASATEKAEDLNNMFADKDVKAIFCVKGGENSNTVFEYLDYDIIKNNPKILCGFSDSTYVTNMITEKTGLVTFSGPTFKSLTSWETDYSFKESVKRFINKDLTLGIPSDEYFTINSGIAQGKLIGGNLSILSKMICGKYSLDFTNKILFIEELGFETTPTVISSILYYMKQNEVFEKISGLWIGNYEHPTNFSLEKIVLDILGTADFPIIKSNNFGHIDKKTVIPIGTLAEINTQKSTKIALLEDCVL